MSTGTKIKRTSKPRTVADAVGPNVLADPSPLDSAGSEPVIAKGTRCYGCGEPAAALHNGLAACTPEGCPRPVDLNAAESIIVSADQAEPWPGLNPRRHFNPEKLAELTRSVKEDGVLQPLLAHDRGAGATPRYWIVAGETRWKAAKAVGKPLPLVVKQFTYAKAKRIALIENMQRNDLTPIEEGRAFKELLETDRNLTQELLGEQIGGKSQEYISNRVRLVELPDEIAELVDSGIILPTHARDYLLPFVKVPDATRAKLFPKLSKRIREERAQLEKEGRPGLTGMDIERIIGEVAMSMSRPLNPLHWPENERPKFDVDIHDKECKCGGPKVRNGHYGESKRRCFDLEWWNAQQSKAIEAEKMKAAKTIEKAKAAGREIEGKAVLGSDSFHEKYQYNQFVALAHGRRVNLHPLLDASLLPAESLLFVKDRSGGLMLVCVDMKAVAKARGAVTKEREALVGAKKAERAAAERAQIDQLAIEPWMLREVMKQRPYTDRLLDIAREHGINLGKHGEVYDALLTLSDSDTETLFKLIAYRGRYGEQTNYSRDPIEEAIDAELRKKYTPLVLALLPSAPKREGLTDEESAELERLLSELDDEDADADVLEARLRCWDDFAARHSIKLSREEKITVENARDIVRDWREEEELETAGV